MRVIIPFTLVVLLLLIIISRIDGLPNFVLLRNGRNDKDRMISERQVEDDDINELRQGFFELINRLKVDDRQTVYSIIQLTAVIESRSCIQDMDRRKRIGGAYYNLLAGTYPTTQHEYKKFLQTLNAADQVILTKLVDTAKATAFERCKLLFANA